MKNNSKHPYVDQLEAELDSGKIDRREFLRRSVLTGMSVAAAYGMVGLTVPGSALAQTPKKGGNLRVAMRVNPTDDPATSEWPRSSNIARHVIENLVDAGTDGISRPYLLKNWEASDDLKTWTLNLRQDVKWSNGDQFNADDVVFNISRWLDPNTGSSMQGRLTGMTEEIDTGEKNEDGSAKMSRVARKGAVTKVDEFTVRLQLNSADISLPESLSDYPALIVHRDFKGKWLSNPIGTGPFSLEKVEAGVTAVLKRRTDGQYWGEEPYLDQITYIDLGDDESADIAAFASDQVDFAHNTPASQVAAMKAIPHLDMIEVVTAATGVARMRVDKKPFDDIRVRKAIMLSVDNAKVLEIGYQGLGQVAENHHVSPAHPAYAPLSNKPKRDVAKAKELLKEAGYPDGIDLRIDCTSTPSWESETCLAIADQAREAGIRIKVNILPASSYWETWQTAPFGFTAWNHRPIAIQVLNLAYRTGGSWNETGYANPEFDKLLDKASATLDAGERRKIMADIEQTLQDDAIILQAYWRSSFSAMNKRVKNMEKHVSFEHHFNKVWIS
ncbi:MAG: ABC transporter substrate-binding protein [Arenicella sp.]